MACDETTLPAPGADLRRELPHLAARELAGVALLALWLLLQRSGRTLLLWRQRSRQRTALADLDDRLLRDIGLDARRAHRETRKWFWQP